MPLTIPENIIYSNVDKDKNLTILKFIFEDLLINCTVSIKNKSKEKIISNKLNIKIIDFVKKFSFN